MEKFINRNPLLGNSEIVRFPDTEAVIEIVECERDELDSRLTEMAKTAWDQAQEIADLKAENERLREAYNDLIMCVSKKYPGESRHDTAKRYILDGENSRIGTAQEALKEAK